MLAPLYKLLRKDVPWRWTHAEEKAFCASKDLLTSSTLLVHFNPELDLILMCDVSSYGGGAVLAHRMPDGSERLIGYASCSLTLFQRNYSQNEKEALALVFGAQRFHAYQFGHCFELVTVTDHKPLLALLHQCKTTSTQASARIRRWSLLLSAYEYSIIFRNTQAHCNADALSRIPLSQTESETPPELAC